MRKDKKQLIGDEIGDEQIKLCTSSTRPASIA